MSVIDKLNKIFYGEQYEPRETDDHTTARAHVHRTWLPDLMFFRREQPLAVKYGDKPWVESPVIVLARDQRSLRWLKEAPPPAVIGLITKEEVVEIVR